MSSQLICLAWDGHHRTLVSVFGKLLVNSHSVDCTIVAEGQKLNAHQGILSAFSPFFELLFNEETENNPIVIISGISFRDLKSLVDFMYQGKLEVTEDRIQDLIDGAECLQIKGLGGGLMEDVSQNLLNSSVLHQRPAVSSGIPHKWAGKGESEVAASVDSEGTAVNNLNYNNDIQLENSVVITCGTKQNEISAVENIMPNSDVENVAIVSNISFIMPAQSILPEIEMHSWNFQGKNVVKTETDSDGDMNIYEQLRDTSRGMSAQFSVSDIEMDSLNFQSEYVAKKEPDSDGDMNINEQLRDRSGGTSAQTSLSEIEMVSLNIQSEYVAKKETDSDGDDKINKPMRDTSRIIHVYGNSENSYESSHEETVVGWSADISVPSGKKVSEDLLDCAPPAVHSSQLGSRNLIASSVKNELCNINVNSSSKSVEHGVETQVPLLESEFHMKTVDASLVSMNNNLREIDELSENVPESFGVPFASNMQMKVAVTEIEKDCSGAAMGSISKSTYSSQDLPVAFVKIQRLGRKEAGVGRPGLPAAVSLHDASTPPSHSTPACDRDLSGPIGRAINDGSSSADMFRCRICNKSFTRNRSLTAHMRMHADPPEEGNNAAGTSIKLNEHHNQSRRKLYKCSVCDFKSEHRASLNNHMRIHSGVKPYKCKDCKYASAYRCNLVVHQRIHSGVKPYKCAECSYSTTHLSTLQSHLRIHSGVKPYKCAECSYSATQRSNLQTHLRIHSGVKPYKCKDCKYASAYRSNLVVHQRIHSGVKP